MFLENADTTGWLVLADGLLVDHHVDAWDLRSVYLILRLLLGELGEELKHLLLACLDVERVVVVELDQVLLQVVQRRRAQIIRRQLGVLHVRRTWRPVASMKIIRFARSPRREALPTWPLEAIERPLHIPYLLIIAVVLVVTVVEERDRGASLVVRSGPSGQFLDLRLTR